MQTVHLVRIKRRLFVPFLFTFLLMVGCENSHQITANSQQPTAMGVPTVEDIIMVDETAVPRRMTASPPPQNTSTAAPTSLPTETATAAATTTPAFPRYAGAPLDGDLMGAQIHIHGEDIREMMGHLRALGMGWVKVQVSWKLYESAPGQYTEDRLRELDRLVEAAAANDIKVLLSVSKAPEWSRPTTELDGPPLDYDLYAGFMNFLAGRYQGRVAAYELWNEPNLQREWNGFPLNTADLVRLTAAGAAGVRAADPAAILISAAPATTGINDGVTRD